MIQIFRGVIRLHNSASWYTLHKQLCFASWFIKLFNSAPHREITTGMPLSYSLRNLRTSIITTPW